LKTQKRFKFYLPFRLLLLTVFDSDAVVGFELSDEAWCADACATNDWRSLVDGAHGQRWICGREKVK
jgi:hypothetical protein